MSKPTLEELLAQMNPEQRKVYEDRTERYFIIEKLDDEMATWYVKEARMDPKNRHAESRKRLEMINRYNRAKNILWAANKPWWAKLLGF